MCSSSRVATWSAIETASLEVVQQGGDHERRLGSVGGVCTSKCRQNVAGGSKGRSWEVVAKAPLVVCSVCSPARRPTAQEPAWCACAKMFWGGGFSRSHVQGRNGDGSPGLQELCEWVVVSCGARRRMIWQRSVGCAPVKSAPGYMCVCACVHCVGCVCVYQIEQANRCRVLDFGRITLGGPVRGVGDTLVRLAYQIMQMPKSSRCPVSAEGWMTT